MTCNGKRILYGSVVEDGATYHITGKVYGGKGGEEYKILSNHMFNLLESLTRSIIQSASILIR